MSYKTEKSVCTKMPYGFDWANLYTDLGLDPVLNPITSSTWDVTNATKGNEFLNGAQTLVDISGGTLGVDVLAHNTIEIDNGTYRECKTIRIKVTG